jgi:hypothetical protein
MHKVSLNNHKNTFQIDTNSDTKSQSFIDVPVETTTIIGGGDKNRRYGFR